MKTTPPPEPIIPMLRMQDLFKLILKPERAYYGVAVIYSVATSILMLAVPVSVQALINTVVNTKMEYFIYVLASILFFILLVSVTLFLCREYVMELFQRRFFARITAEATLRLVASDQRHVETINRAELVNRFFEVMHVQKIVPSLLTHGFSVLLQMTVGLIVVSFYHPFLLIFNVIFLFTLYLIWGLWAPRATQASLRLSESKYDLVHWMEEIARANNYFKSEKTIQYGLDKIDEKTQIYLKSSKRFFRYTFSQSAAFLIVFCLANAALLGLGGALVAEAQLSIGQLIGAELIMSTIFYNLLRIGSYTRMYYELCASLEKIGLFYQLPTEEMSGTLRVNDNNIDINFRNLTTEYRGHIFRFEMQIPSGKKVLIRSQEPSGSKVFIDLLKGYNTTSYDKILVNGVPLPDYDLHALRENILVIDNFTIVEGTIRELFQILSPDIQTDDIHMFLDITGLNNIIGNLPQGIDTPLSPTGYPLLPEEIIGVKLAVVMAAAPAVIVITEVLDYLPMSSRNTILKHICQTPNLTLICFSNKKQSSIFNDYYYVGPDATRSFATIELLSLHEDKMNQEV
jgi:putative ABC transport system ATP-binding protein